MRGSKAYRSSVVARQREPGWYANPGSPGQWRWWDGGSWTEHSVSADPKAEPATRGGGGAEGGQPGEPADTVAGGVGAGVDVEAGPPLPPGAAGDGDQPAGAPLPLGPPTLSGPIAGPVAGPQSRANGRGRNPGLEGAYGPRRTRGGDDPVTSDRGH